MEEYEALKNEIVVFEEEDVITNSPPTTNRYEIE